MRRPDAYVLAARVHQRRLGLPRLALDLEIELGKRLLSRPGALATDPKTWAPHE